MYPIFILFFFPNISQLLILNPFCLENLLYSLGRVYTLQNFLLALPLRMSGFSLQILKSLSAVEKCCATSRCGLWRLSRGCVCVYQSAEWALVKGLTGTDLVVVQALNDHQSRK